MLLVNQREKTESSPGKRSSFWERRANAWPRTREYGSSRCSNDVQLHWKPKRPKWAGKRGKGLVGASVRARGAQSLFSKAKWCYQRILGFHVFILTLYFPLYFTILNIWSRTLLPLAFHFNPFLTCQWTFTRSLQIQSPKGVRLCQVHDVLPCTYAREYGHGSTGSSW